MSVQPNEEQWELYEDEAISFMYPAGCRAWRIAKSPKIYHAIECRKRKNGVVVELSSVTDPLALETLRADINEFTPLADGYYTRRATRHGRVCFRHLVGDELLIVRQRNMDGVINGCSWRMILESQQATILVTLDCSGPVDEGPWLKCFDSIDLRGE